MKWGFILIGAIALAACATAPKMNALRVGMTKTQVLATMGQPMSTAATGDVQVLRYRLSNASQAFYGLTSEYFVKLVDGKVTSFGKMGDFDSTKDPTVDVNLTHKTAPPR